MSSECQSTNCSCVDLYSYLISVATGSDDAAPDYICPDGYYWGGASCVADSDDCSSGYKWDGTACIEDDDDFECATGYYYSGGACLECTFDLDGAAFISLTSIAGDVVVEYSGPATATNTMKIYYSLNGSNYTLAETLVDVTSAVQQYLLGGFALGSAVCVYMTVNIGDTCGEIASQAKCIITSTPIP